MTRHETPEMHATQLELGDTDLHRFHSGHTIYIDGFPGRCETEEPVIANRLTSVRWGLHYYSLVTPETTTVVCFRKAGGQFRTEIGRGQQFRATAGRKMH